jgi:hypothetical protein
MGILGSIFKAFTRNGVRVSCGGGKKNKGVKHVETHGSIGGSQGAFNDGLQPSMNLRGDLREILATEFAQFQVQENVAVAAIDASAQFGGPIDFVLINGGAAVLAIMVIEQGKKRTKRVHGVELACTNTGVAFANFYTHFGFDRALAVAYIRKFVG